MFQRETFEKGEKMEEIREEKLEEMKEEVEVTKNETTLLEQIQEKRKRGEKLTGKERIFLKQQELRNLKASIEKQEKKNKKRWVKPILEAISKEILKFATIEEIEKNANLEKKIKVTFTLIKSIKDFNENIQIDTDIFEINQTKTNFKIKE